MTAPADTVLRVAGDQALALGHRLLDPRRLEAACAGAGLDHDAFIAGVRALAEERLMDARTFGDSLITLVRLTEQGVDRHLAAAGVDVEAARRRVGEALEAEKQADRLGEAIDLPAALDLPPLLVEVVLDDLRDRGQLVFSRVIGRRIRLHRVGPPEKATG